MRVSIMINTIIGNIDLCKQTALAVHVENAVQKFTACCEWKGTEMHPPLHWRDKGLRPGEHAVHPLLCSAQAQTRTHVNAYSLISRVQAQICPYPANTFLVRRIWRRNIWHKPGRRGIASVATQKHCQAPRWRPQGARRSPGCRRRGRNADRQRQCPGPAHHRPSDSQVGRL